MPKLVVITIALFFLPVINGLIGGFVGGYKVGSPGRAMRAAVLPAAIVAGGLWLLLIAFNLPVVAFAAGIAVGFLILVSDLGIFVGALVGGAMSNRRLGHA